MAKMYAGVLRRFSRKFRGPFSHAFVQQVLASFFGFLALLVVLWMLGLRWLSVLWLGFGSW